jgi:hypothetical protein
VWWSEHIRRERSRLQIAVSSFLAECSNTTKTQRPRLLVFVGLSTALSPAACACLVQVTLAVRQLPDEQYPAVLQLSDPGTLYPWGIVPTASGATFGVWIVPHNAALVLSR